MRIFHWQSLSGEVSIRSQLIDSIVIDEGIEESVGHAIAGIHLSSGQQIDVILASEDELQSFKKVMYDIMFAKDEADEESVDG